VLEQQAFNPTAGVFLSCQDSAAAARTVLANLFSPAWRCASVNLGIRESAPGGPLRLIPSTELCSPSPSVCECSLRSVACADESLRDTSLSSES